MLTIKAEVLKDKKRRDGTYNVKIRFIKEKRVKRISTNLFAEEDDLTTKLRLKEESYVKQQVDRLILHYRKALSSLNVDWEKADVEEIVNRLLCKEEAEKPIDFIAFSRKWISETSIKSKDTYTTGLNAFVRFIGKEEWDIKKITVDLLEHYRDFLLKERILRVKRTLRESIPLAKAYLMTKNTYNLYMSLFEETKLIDACSVAAQFLSRTCDQKTNVSNECRRETALHAVGMVSIKQIQRLPFFVG